MKVLFQYLSDKYTKATATNELFDPFFKYIDSSYDFDKAIVSKLASHKINIPQKVIKAVLKFGNASKKEFERAIQDITDEKFFLFLEGLAEEIETHKTESAKELSRVLDFYKGSEVSDFLNAAFVYAVLSPNAPSEKKQKTGRPKGGTHEYIFYLSQTEKEEQAKVLKNKILKSVKKLTLDDLRDILALMTYTTVCFSKEEKVKASLRFLQGWKVLYGLTPTQELLQTIKDIGRFSEPDVREIFVGWEEAVYEANDTKKANHLKNLFTRAKRMNSFANISKYADSLVDEEDLGKSGAFSASLVRNKFFLPNFLDHLTSSLWSYCCSVARLAHKAGVQKDFEKKLDDMMAVTPKNKTTTERIEYLRELATQEISRHF